MFNLLWQIYYAFVHNFSVVSGQILKKLSSHLVTLLLLHPFDEIEKTYFLTFQVFRNRRENFRATFLTFCRKRIRRRIDVVCRKGRNYSLKPVWPQIGRFLKVLSTNFIWKVAQILVAFVSYFGKFWHF